MTVICVKCNMKINQYYAIGMCEQCFKDEGISLNKTAKIMREKND